jgi:glycerol uptake facilitator-like aquaporin
MLRSVIALIAGFAIMTFTFLVVLTVAISVRGVPPEAAPAASAALGVWVWPLAAFAGGYSTAALAPARTLGHGYVLAAMVGVARAYDLLSPPDGAARTTLLALLVACPLLAIAGAWVRERQVRRRRAAA